MASAKTSRNLWPLGIVAAFAVFIPATAGLIVLALLHKEELVRPDYYEQEIRYQGQMERLERARGLGGRASVVYDSARGQITIALPAEHALGKAQGRIHLYRPSAAGLDHQFELAPNASGVQTLEAKDLRPGLWKVRVSWSVAAQEYLIDEKIVVRPGAT